MVFNISDFCNCKDFFLARYPILMGNSPCPCFIMFEVWGISKTKSKKIVCKSLDLRYWTFSPPPSSKIVYDPTINTFDPRTPKIGIFQDIESIIHIFFKFLKNVEIWLCWHIFFYFSLVFPFQTYYGRIHKFMLNSIISYAFLNMQKYPNFT